MKLLLRATLMAAMLSLVIPVQAQTVLADRSEIRFMVKQLGVAVEGRFRRWKANVVFHPDAPSRSKAEFDIDLASVDLAGDDSEAEVKGAHWFDTTRHPTARFTSTSVRSVGGDRYEIAGPLTMKGITRDIVVPVTIRRESAGTRVAEGTFLLRRLDFKLGEGQWADTDLVANDVSVRVRIVLASAA